MFRVRRGSLCLVILSSVFLSVALVGLPANAGTNSVRGPNRIFFSPLNSLFLSTHSYPLSGISTSGLPLTYVSLTPDTCSVSGTTLILINPGSCTVQASQKGSNLIRPARPVQVSITISDTHVTSDQVDVVTGFQIKAIYVVPSDGTDHSYDTNGYIAAILDEGNNYLREQLGLQVPIDKHVVGYDIQYLKSNLSTAILRITDGREDELFAEIMALENPSPNRKSYMFFIDIDDMRNGEACGVGAVPGISAFVAIGTECTGNSFNFENYATQSWVHELFHNFGVSHTPDDPCDLMRGSPENTGTCPSDGSLTIDQERSRYVNSSTQGQDLMQLRVWEGYTDRLDLEADCSLNPVERSDGFNYAYCPTGTQTIGALKHCWESIRSTVLQEFVNGKWKRLGAGFPKSAPWSPKTYWYGTRSNWECDESNTAPSKRLNVTSPGVRLYRWMVNGKESEQFKVIWVR